MSLVKSKDNRTGITYVYESESYWDKEKKQPRAHRKLIGKIDPDTGEIVPTEGRGRKPGSRKKEASPAPADEAEKQPGQSPDWQAQLSEKDARIAQLLEENRQLKSENEAILAAIGSVLEKHGHR